MKRHQWVGWLRTLIFAGLLAASTATATAQPPTPSPVPTQTPAQDLAQTSRPHWTVDHGEVYCTLSRYYGPDQTTFAIRIIPGTARVELLVSNPRWRFSPIPRGTPVDVTLQPEGRKFRVDALTGRLARNIPFLAFLDFEPGLIDSVASASQLQLVRGRRAIVSLDLPQADRAVRSLRECHDRTLTNWGIDLPLRATLQALPQLENSPFSSNDYPLSALSDDAQGLVVVRLTVGVDGRVSNCRVLRSSTNAALDQRSCREFSSSGRFKPAIDAEGRPIELPVISTVVWRIGGR